MPPPRLLRPLRPCRTPWSSRQIRWASEAPRGKHHAQHGDPRRTLSSGDGAQEIVERDVEEIPATRECSLSSAEPSPPSQPASTGWWGSIIGRATTLASEKTTTRPEESSRFVPPGNSHPSPQSSEPSDSLFKPAGPLGSTEAHATQEYIENQKKHCEKGEGKEESGDQAVTKTHVCATCQEDFRSTTLLSLHKLLNDRCWVDKPNQFIQYSCRSCKLNFSSRAEVRDHVDRSPGCYNYIQFRHLRAIAEKRFRRSTGTLIIAARMLNSMSSPTTKPLALKVNEHLRLILDDTTVAKDKQWLATLKNVAVPDLPQSGSETHEPLSRSGSKLVRKLDQESVSIERQAQSKTQSVPQSSTDRLHSELRIGNTKKRLHSKKELRVLKNNDQKASQNSVSEPSDETRLNIPAVPPRIATPQPSDPLHLPQSSVSATSSLDQNADLRLQLDQLVEQVRLLQERLSSSVIQPGTSHDGQSNIEILRSETTTGVAKGWETDSLKSDESVAARDITKSHGRNLSSTTSGSRILEPVKQLSRVPPLQTETQASLVEKLRPTQGPKGDSPATSMSAVEDDGRGPLADLASIYDTPVESRVDSQRLTRQIHTHARLMNSSNHSDVDSSKLKPSSLRPTKPAQRSADSTSASPGEVTSSGEMSEQSLLEELFPEASNYIQPHYSERNSYPKLELPRSVPVVRRLPYDVPKSERERVIESFQKRSEQITALQLLHCSTELTEADFRRLVPKGKHIESWTREGEFYKVIPGRDPLSLERLPFYYLLFKSPESALAYQKNVSRLHKLSQLHQPSNILSAIPPPKGFLEDGEDINLATTSYLLKPTSLQLNLNMVMQPYNPALHALIDQGGYKPIVPSTTPAGKPIWKVLMHIEGYEPSPMDLYQLLRQDGYARGIQWPFHNEQSAILRLRDIINLKAKLLPVSSSNPRAAKANPEYKSSHHMFEDPNLSFLTQDPDQDNAMQVNQVLMNRLYNRWIIEFEEEDAARRFARMWNRRVLPVSKSSKHVTWRDIEEARMCNAEFLW